MHISIGFYLEKLCSVVLLHITSLRHLHPHVTVPEVKVTEIPMSAEAEKSTSKPVSEYLRDLDEETPETLHVAATSKPLHDVIDKQTPLQDVTGLNLNL